MGQLHSTKKNKVKNKEKKVCKKGLFVLGWKTVRKIQKKSPFCVKDDKLQSYVGKAIQMTQ